MLLIEHNVTDTLSRAASIKTLVDGHSKILVRSTRPYTVGPTGQDVLPKLYADQRFV